MESDETYKAPEVRGTVTITMSDRPKVHVPISGPSPEHTAPYGLLLSGQQRALLQALEEHNPKLGVMYVGGLRVLADSTNPDRFSLSAHAMRELMEKLPAYLEAPTKAQKESLTTKVRDIEAAFKNMKAKTKCHSTSSGWDGTIDAPLRKFLQGFTTFLDWLSVHKPKRRDELHETLLRLDGSGRALPAGLASLNVDAWNEKREYFQAIAHHGKGTEDEEFAQRLDALERFLLDRLLPKTFDDFAEIDSLLEIGGNGG